MSKWVYDEPDIDGKNIKHILIEDEILNLYWETFKSEMQAALLNPNTRAFGKPELITKENCIEHWIIIHWAYPYKLEQQEIDR